MKRRKSLRSSFCALQSHVRRNLNLKAEHRQKKSSDSANEFLAKIIDHLPLGMFCKDYENGDGTIVAWNNFAESLFGLQKKQAIGKTDRDFFPPEQCEHFKRVDLETLKTGQLQYTDEESVDSPSLGPRLVRTWKVPIQGKFLLGISQDISLEKSLQKQLEQQKAVAFNAAKLASLGEVAGGIAHEINNPLAIISGQSLMLAKKLKSGVLTFEEAERITENIGRTIVRIQNIVDGLRKHSRDDSLEQSKQINVITVVEEASAFCSERMRKSSIELKMLTNPNEDMTIMGRDVQLSQVFVNLISNSIAAIKGMNSPWIEISISKTNGKILIAFTDSGSGIPTSMQEKIFQPFFTTKDIGEGTGLGLSISKGIIESHAGSLRLNHLHNNTQFIVELNEAINLKKAG
ncbi:MAG: ATP-binding protein [Proteobacteria bacterium]|nr:ATP-binding protein [Pseudomonadota bacterium]